MPLADVADGAEEMAVIVRRVAFFMYLMQGQWFPDCATAASPGFCGLTFPSKRFPFFNCSLHMRNERPLLLSLVEQM